MIAALVLCFLDQVKDNGVEVTRNVEYGNVDEQPLLLDIYRGKLSASKRPAVVFIHGGGWQSGSKDKPPSLVIDLARAGFVSVSINYRLLPKSKWPAQIYDCKTAIRFLRLSGSQYGIDETKIGVWGMSAGGHLAALLGTSGGVWELEGLPDNVRAPSSAVQAVVDLFGPTDIVKLVNLRKQRIAAKLKVDDPARGGLSPEEKLIGGTVLEKADIAKQASPITYITKDDPPFLIVHGEDDITVFPDQSILLDAALRKAGVPVTLKLVRGMGHSLKNPEINQWVIDFFTRTLKGEDQ